MEERGGQIARREGGKEGEYRPKNQIAPPNGKGTNLTFTENATTLTVRVSYLHHVVFEVYDQLDRAYVLLEEFGDDLLPIPDTKRLVLIKSGDLSELNSGRVHTDERNLVISTSPKNSEAAYFRMELHIPLGKKQGYEERIDDGDVFELTELLAVID